MVQMPTRLARGTGAPAGTSVTVPPGAFTLLSRSRCTGSGSPTSTEPGGRAAPAISVRIRLPRIGKASSFQIVECCSGKPM